MKPDLPKNGRILRVLQILPMTGPVDPGWNCECVRCCGRDHPGRCADCAGWGETGGQHCRKCEGGGICSVCGGSAETAGMIDVVVVGGGDEPLHPQWVRDAFDQCKAAGVVPVFLGWGKYAPFPPPTIILHGGFNQVLRSGDIYMLANGDYKALTAQDCADPSCTWQSELEGDDGQGEFLRPLGKKRAGRELDGETYGWPEDLKP